MFWAVYMPADECIPGQATNRSSEIAYPLQPGTTYVCKSVQESVVDTRSGFLAGSPRLSNVTTAGSKPKQITQAKPII